MVDKRLNEEQIKRIHDIYLDAAKEEYEESGSTYKANRAGKSAACEAFPDFSKRAIARKLEKFRDGQHTKEAYLVEDKAEAPDESYHKSGDYEHHDGFYFIPFKGEIHKFPEEKVENLVDVYSNWDNNSLTINETCREIGAPRALVIRILRVLGVTHDSAPFTPEELKQEDTEDLWDDLKVKKERELEKKLQEYEEKDKRRELMKWRKFKARELNPLIDEMEELPSIEVPSIELEQPENEKLNCHIPLQDFHFGGFGTEEEHGKEWNMDVARQRLLGHVKRLIPKIVANGKPARITVSIGGDYLHIDNIKGGTSHGTTMDHDGSPKQIQTKGFQLARTFIELLSEIAPVHVVRVEGNHDRMLSSALIDFLCFGFEDHDNVNVESTIKGRYYETWGNCLLGYAHGFDMKEKRVPKIMPVEAEEHWSDCDHRIMFTGHLHSLYADYDGILMLRCPSLSGTDEYHKRNGYIGATKGLSVFIVHKDYGWTGLENTPVK